MDLIKLKDEKDQLEAREIIEARAAFETIPDSMGKAILQELDGFNKELEILKVLEPDKAQIKKLKEQQLGKELNRLV